MQGAGIIYHDLRVRARAKRRNGLQRPCFVVTRRHHHCGGVVESNPSTTASKRFLDQPNPHPGLGQTRSPLYTVDTPSWEGVLGSRDHVSVMSDRPSDRSCQTAPFPMPHASGLPHRARSHRGRLGMCRGLRKAAQPKALGRRRGVAARHLSRGTMAANRGSFEVTAKLGPAPSNRSPKWRVVRP